MKKLSLLLICLLLFSNVAIAFANEDDNPFVNKRKQFNVPVEAAYIFVFIIIIAVLVYVGARWLFVEEL